ncbi:2-(1,2-epoxy-1,2-dihydrophenyl)acetyl-CoA isomerase PaaG [Paremcibacter congregatus]|uniref:2-(1,2-epoxy-1,2-dihydrophenyl)acetyl-CoA isomerase n=1 Tax=Paremcibacter congregatus TaxID=2043170 RepID=A0A2G4YU07_9PROT|nr:2-(1,2-epoxy-1,2-dihydrophenyl)acetyl-CoA isomerase PaaG [Paremcibacter congregatus]PHZ85822.1 2-(1,2-epoxy-1,2-dihydrophenyl)acetyl-CoA isomerase [Paremcibacter congregatus]QDE26785.1 2-(1,2-epoxy-1,2-dihydrophenyl)acetyl-CoA isomerase [Paremcibacter congregatus]
MSYNNITFTLSDGLATLTLNRPDSLNSFTSEMHEEVRHAMNIVESDPSVRCLLLTGNGRGFCAGQDLNDRAVKPGDGRRDLSESVDQNYNPLIKRLAALPMPVICAVNGVAAGAGANLALACDMVFAAKSAKFIQVFCKIGLIPDSGGTYILPRLVGNARAMGLALTGEAIKAEQAEDWGMIWKAVEDEDLMTVATKQAQDFTTQPTLGLSLIKKALRASFDNDLNGQLQIESDYQREAGYSDDYQEGVAAFLAKRKPDFTGK